MRSPAPDDDAGAPPEVKLDTKLPRPGGMNRPRMAAKSGVARLAAEPKTVAKWRGAGACAGARRLARSLFQLAVGSALAWSP